MNLTMLTPFRGQTALARSGGISRNSGEKGSPKRITTKPLSPKGVLKPIPQSLLYCPKVGFWCVKGSLTTGSPKRQGYSKVVLNTIP